MTGARDWPRHAEYAVSVSIIAGVTFVPIVMETLGGMSALTVDTLASLGRLLGQRLGVNTSDSVPHLLQRCSISVWRGNAALWLRRSPVFAPSVDGVY